MWRADVRADAANNGLPIAGNQARTRDHDEERLQLAPELPQVPVPQGGSMRDCLSHLDNGTNGLVPIIGGRGRPQ